MSKFKIEIWIFVSAYVMVTDNAEIVMDEYWDGLHKCLDSFRCCGNFFGFFSSIFILKYLLSKI